MGQFLAFGVPFYDQIKEQWYLFEEGCFGDLSKQIVEFQFSHNPATKAGDTTNALKLCQNGRFCFDLEKAENGRGPLIASLCASGAASAISIGATFIRSHEEQVGDERVIVITEAKLNEISQVDDGMAGDNAFAFVVDTSEIEELVDGVHSEVYDVHHTLHKLSRGVKALKERVREREQRANYEFTSGYHREWQAEGLEWLRIRAVRRATERSIYAT